MNKHSITIDGKTHTRNSEHHTYTHAVAARVDRNKALAHLATLTDPKVRDIQERYIANREAKGVYDWHVTSWAGSAKLADRVARQQKGWGNESQVIEVGREYVSADGHLTAIA